ncbi:MAG: D-2-hydroxyacid dehydrogenase [Desulfovibrio sp.]|jgi:glycerate dehydrogenase|nr:D-2-hydroxyacid dehydrogenase [Desulfovibrio sp.]
MRKGTVVFPDAGSIGDDFAWPDFSDFGEVVMYDRTLPEQTEERIRDAAFILTKKAGVTAGDPAATPALRYIGALGTGFNHVDIRSAAARGIPVCNVPDYSTPSVVQHVFTLILLLSSRVCELSASVRRGGWSKSRHPRYRDKPAFELHGKTLGIVGFGNIGAGVARVAHGFGMHVLAYAPRPKSAPDFRPFDFVGLNDLFARSDVVSLHCPLNRESEGMVDARLLGLMKTQALLINTARGPLVNERDLLDALREKRIGGAGLDVVAVEPMADDNPLRFAPNCMITPHAAWSGVESRMRLMRIAYDNIRAFLDGAPVNVVNGVARRADQRLSRGANDRIFRA